VKGRCSPRSSSTSAKDEENDLDPDSCGSGPSRWRWSRARASELVVGLGNPAASTRRPGNKMVSSHRPPGRRGRGGQVHPPFDGLSPRPRSTSAGLAPEARDVHEPQRRAVASAFRSTSSSLADLLVVCDDLSLPWASLRIRGGGSDGGSEGLRDITGPPGYRQLCPLRIGIGAAGPSMPTTSSSAWFAAPNARSSTMP